MIIRHLVPVEKLMLEKKTSIDFWRQIIQNHYESGNDAQARKDGERMGQIARNFDRQIDEKRLELHNRLINELSYEQKLLDLSLGGLPGLVMVSQFDEVRIIDGRTSFHEFIHCGVSFFTAYRMDELPERKARFGCVLFSIDENGTMRKIDANYDSSD